MEEWSKTRHLYQSTINLLFIGLSASLLATLINCLYFRTVIRLELYSLRSAIALLLLVLLQNLPSVYLIMFHTLTSNELQSSLLGENMKCLFTSDFLLSSFSFLNMTRVVDDVMSSPENTLSRDHNAENGGNDVGAGRRLDVDPTNDDNDCEHYFLQALITVNARRKRFLQARERDSGQLQYKNTASNTSDTASDNSNNNSSMDSKQEARAVGVGSKEEHSLGVLKMSRLVEMECCYVSLVGRRLTRTDAMVIVGTILSAQLLSFIGFGG